MKLIPFFIITAIALLGIPSLFIPGFFPMHDDAQVARTWQMAKALKGGQFPVRWVADLGYGYGYPIFNFYNPLPYYISAFLVLTGFDILMATKIMILLGFLLSALSMFLLSRYFFGIAGGILSALLYVYAPYHAVQLYVRGSIGELWAYAILPVVILGIIKKDKILGGISLAFLVLSHNLTIIMVLPIIIVLMIILVLREKNKRSLLYCYIVTLLIGFCLSAFFWLPALFEKKYTAVNQMINEQFNPLLHFVNPEQLWYSPWGYAGSAPPGEIDGMSFQIGKPNLILTIATIILIILFWKSQQKNLKIILSFIVFWLLSIFLILPISAPIWQMLFPIMKYLQFPWRFLTLVAFFGAVLSGYLISYLKKLLKKNIYIFLFLSTIFILFFNLKYFVPQFIYKASAKDFINDEKIHWEVSSRSDEYLPYDFPRPKNKDELFRHKYLFDNGEIQEIKRTSTFYELALKSESENRLTINTAFFPGWKAWLDGQSVKIDNSHNLINLGIPAGQHLLVVKFTDTLVRTVSNFISLSAFLIIFLKLLFFSHERD